MNRNVLTRIIDSQAVRLASLLAITCIGAFAGGVSMPWNTPLTLVSGNLTGPTALGLMGIGAFGSFAPHIFNTEVPHFVHTSAKVTLGGGALLGIGKIVSYFGLGGALL